VGLPQENPEKIDPVWRRLLESPETLGERVFERIWLYVVTYEPTSVRDAEEIFTASRRNGWKMVTVHMRFAET